MRNRLAQKRPASVKIVRNELKMLPKRSKLRDRAQNRLEHCCCAIRDEKKRMRFSVNGKRTLVTVHCFKICVDSARLHPGIPVRMLSRASKTKSGFEILKDLE